MKIQRTGYCIMLKVFIVFVVLAVNTSQQVKIDGADVVKIGCYRDRGWNRAMDQSKLYTVSMTLDKCRNECLKKYSTSTYFATEYKWECYCADTYDKHGPLPDDYCNTTCGGNKSQICGGDNALSVYTVCPQGYHGTDCDVPCGKCMNGTIGCLRRNGTCFPGGCQSGWTNYTCKTDIDECKTGDYSCPDETQNRCVNNNGSYWCECSHGYEHFYDGKITRCVDTNECETSKHSCETDSRIGSCINTLGSYKCICGSGYKLSQNSYGTCEDIDECSARDPPDRNNCTNSRCLNTKGDYNCSCYTGFQPTTDPKTCQDINECKENNGGCQQGCNNTEGGFHCYCNIGYIQQRNNKSACKDINECSQNSGGCEHTCENTEGSYFCSCPDGYDLGDDKLSCIERNECAVNKGNCSHECENTPGSYRCYCWNGYSLMSDRHQCKDIDECKEDIHDCDREYGVCSNNPGSYSCDCKPGFELMPPAHDASHDTNKCTDRDECLDRLSIQYYCGGEDQTCTNTQGSYQCDCAEGFARESDRAPCLRIPQGWKYGVAAFVVVVIACIILMIAFYIRKRRQALVKQHNADPQVVPSLVVDKKPDSSGKLLMTKKKPEIPAKTSSKDRLVDSMNSNGGCDEGEDKEEYSIYANFKPPVTARSPTRIKISDLPALIKRVRDMPKALSEEFKKIAENSGESCKYAEHKDLKSKNRFKNILPYDHNRVTLNQIGSDTRTTYINASFLKGYKGVEKFIASHGPIQTTIGDFWRMIWEYKAHVIVMVTKCKEDLKMKCELYWPEDSQALELDNGLSIRLCSAQHFTEYVVRKFTLSNEGETRDIVHLQYTAWPDHGVPDHSISLLSLRQRVKTLHPPSDKTPIVVHCSAGVGRTGTYIGLDNLLDEAEDVGEIDIHNTVIELRKQRMNCVQSLDQYTFLFKAVYEGLIFGKTRIPSSQISERIAGLQSAHNITGRPVIQTEFQIISEMMPPYSEEQCSDALSPANKRKNRNTAIIPPNSQRVYVSSGSGNDYINAVFVPSHSCKDAYIATQLPLRHTVGDFWAMCLDHSVSMVVVLSRDGKDDEALMDLLPKPGSCLRFGKLYVGDTQLQQQLKGNSIATAAENSCWDLYSITIKYGFSEPEISIYENTQSLKQQIPAANDDSAADESREVKVDVLVTSLPGSEAVLNDSMLRVCREVTSLVENREQSPIVVTCSTGVTLCGPYLASSICSAMIQSDDVVDVVQTVLDLKKSQPLFIATQHDYEKVYRVAELCANQTSTYANVL